MVWDPVRKKFEGLFLNEEFESLHVDFVGYGDRDLELLMVKMDGPYTLIVKVVDRPSLLILVKGALQDASPRVVAEDASLIDFLNAHVEVKSFYDALLVTASADSVNFFFFFFTLVCLFELIEVLSIDS